MEKKKRSPAKRRRRAYTLDEKREILECAEREGVSAAAKNHDCKPTTISNWLNRDRERLMHQLAVARGDEAQQSPSVGDQPAQQAGSAEGADREVRVRASKGHRYSPAQRKLILADAEKDGPAEAARRHDCSTWSIRQWKKNAARSASAAEDQPDEDKVKALTPEQEERHRLVKKTWRKNPGFGPSQVRNQLKRYGYKVSVHTVRDIMTDSGYIQPRVKPKDPPEEYEADRPMQLFHLDFVHFYIHKLRQCVLWIEDDYSRFIAGWALMKSEHARGVIEAVDIAIKQYGKPEGIMVDRASCFFSFKGVAGFERHITDDNIDYYPINEAHKNGKVEKLNGTVRKELITQVEFADLDDAQIKIRAWVHNYNYRRTHMGLGGLLVPADRFHGMAEDALRRIEQGNGASPLDILTPTGRGLEIFRICSVAGQPSVFLMGQKVFG